MKSLIAAIALVLAVAGTVSAQPPTPNPNPTLICWPGNLTTIDQYETIYYYNAPTNSLIVLTDQTTGDQWQLGSVTGTGSFPPFYISIAGSYHADMWQTHAGRPMKDIASCSFVVS